MHETVRVKVNLQWRSQRVRDARNMEHLPRKAAGSEHNQPKRETMWAEVSKVRLSKHFSAHITPWTLDSGHETTEFVGFAGFHSCFTPIHPIFPFWKGNVCVKTQKCIICCFLKFLQRLSGDFRLNL
jgi:hypothetical protein